MSTGESKTRSRHNIRKIMTQYMLLFIVIVVFLVFSVLLKDTFPTINNTMTFLRQGSIYGALVLGVTWVLGMGEMDVSFAEIAAFSSVATAYFSNLGLPLDAAAMIAILLGGCFGLLNGFLVTKFRLPSLIVTIAVSGLAKAIGQTLARGKTVPIVKDTGSVVYNILWGDVAGVPVILIVAAVCMAVMMVIQEKTRFGQYIYAIGDNKKSAEVAGIKIHSIYRIVFFIASVFAAFGGVMLLLTVNSGQPTIGSTIFLDSFTKLFLGAMLFKIGKTNVLGTLVGAILMAMLTNGLTQMGASSYVSQIVTGLLLIVGVALSSIVQKKRNVLVMG